MCFPTCRRSVNSIKGYEATAWYGVGAPRETSRPIVEKLNREINAVLADSRMKAKFDDLGCVLIGGSPAEFGKLIAEETEKWGKVVKFAGARARIDRAMRQTVRRTLTSGLAVAEYAVLDRNRKA